jgi:RHS repeat-associated protein
MQGQYYDPEIDLCYNRYRYFDPQICSFISQDPLGLAAGENIYAYAPNVWGWVDPLGLACKQNLPKYENWQQFRGDFSSSYMTRPYARSLWHEYQDAPDRFFGRKNVLDILKAKGHLPYSPAERLENAYIDANHAYALTHGDSHIARAVQFSTEFINGLLTPPGSPSLYGTLAGKLGSISSSIAQKVWPLIARLF